MGAGVQRNPVPLLAQNIVRCNGSHSDIKSYFLCCFNSPGQLFKSDIVYELVCSMTGSHDSCLPSQSGLMLAYMYTSGRGRR